MKVEFKPDFPVTDDACKKATGKTLKQWITEIDKSGNAEKGRRETISWLYEQMGGGKDVWWPTTVWVEFEKSKGVVNKKDGRAEGYNICVTKTIAAPVADVYKAWVDGKSLKKWFGEGVDAKVKDGGAFKDEGGHSGEYLRVRENKDLRFTWNHATAEAPTQVDVAFADKGKGKTGITLNHQRIQNRAEADGLRNAWGAAFDSLKVMLEG